MSPEQEAVFLILLFVISVFQASVMNSFLNLKPWGSSGIERSGMKVHTADVTLQKTNKSTLLLLVDKQTRGNPSDRSLVYSLHSLLAKALPPSI